MTVKRGMKRMWRGAITDSLAGRLSCGSKNASRSFKAWFVRRSLPFKECLYQRHEQTLISCYRRPLDDCNVAKNADSLPQPTVGYRCTSDIARGAKRNKFGKEVDKLPNGHYSTGRLL